MHSKRFVALCLAIASSGCAHQKLYPLERLCSFYEKEGRWLCVTSKGTDYQLSPEEGKKLLCVPQADFKAYAEACHSQ